MDYNGTDKDDSIDQAKLKLPNGTDIFAFDGNDVVYLAGGNVEGGPGNDTLIGSVPWDQAIYWNSPKGVVIDLPKGTVQDGYGTVDTIQGINHFAGSGKNDFFIGNAANNQFWSLSIHDVMDGGPGIDKAVINITNSNVVPEFLRIGTGWSIRYMGGSNAYYTLDTTSVEVLSIYRGNLVWELWDLTAEVPRPVPDASTIFQPVPYLLTEREQWKIRAWGLEKLTFTEDAGAWYYPTATDYHAPANVAPAMHNAAIGDFNGDGYQDMIISWIVFPHVIPHLTRPMPTILWGSPTGLVKAADGALPDTVVRHMSYRTFAANLNGDGVDDIVTGAMSTPVWTDVEHSAFTWESAPTLAVFGSANGKMQDVSNYLEGQTLTQGSANSEFDHATAVGDLNHDGLDDIFSGNNLWVSQTNGQWQDATSKVQSLLPSATPPAPMSLAIGDLNGDGTNDILALYPDFHSDRIVLFNGPSSDLNFRKLVLPPGLFGANTKDNFAIIADVNYDGLNDIVVAETRALPYYIGSAMQILIQTSQGAFEDQTASRIDNSKRDSVQGEGQLFWIDVNGDGYKDIVHSNDGDGVAIFINDGHGHFTQYDSAQLNPIRTIQLDGFQTGLYSENDLPSFRANPIDNNHDGIIDWVVGVSKPRVTGEPTEDAHVALYILDSTGKEFGRDQSEVLTGTLYNDKIYGLAGNDQIQGKTGNDFLDGGDGVDTALYSLKSVDARLRWAGDNWIVDAGKNLGSDTLKSIEILEFSDRNVNISAALHPSYDSVPDDLWHFFIVAFNGAPGVTYMNQLKGAYETGLSVKDIVNVFTTKSQFTDIYPQSLSKIEFAEKITNNVVKNSASTEAKQKAVSDIVGALDSGLSRGDVIYNVFGNLSSVPTTNAVWGNTSKQFENQIAVAQFYTDDMSQSTTYIPQLRAILGSVDQNSDVSSDDSIIEIIGTALLSDFSLYA